jgi:hypothetical protein
MSDGPQALTFDEIESLAADLHAPFPFAVPLTG